MNRLPRSYKFTLADRMMNELYDLLSDLVMARYAQEKLGKARVSKLQIGHSEISNTPTI